MIGEVPAEAVNGPDVEDRDVGDAPRRPSGRIRRGRELAVDRVCALLRPVRRGWERIPARWRFVLGLFVGTKLVLTFVGLLVVYANDPVNGLPLSDHRIQTETERGTLDLAWWLSMWFAWDSFNYERIVRMPVGDDWTDFAFPLLYPYLGKAVAPVLGGHTALALLVVTNIAFVLLLYYAHRLGELLLGDEAAGRRFTKYVVLMPAGFLFHAALTESLFLCLVLASFYYAETGRWAQAGILGYFVAMSRSLGFLLVISLALVLLRQGGYRLNPRALVEYLRIGWPLVLVPTGWLTFMAFCRWRSGDWFAYSHAQEAGWQITVQNPFRTVWEGVTSEVPRDAGRIWLVVVALALALIAMRYVKPAYVVYTIIVILVPLSIGAPGYRSLIRYLVVAFPIALLFSAWARRPAVDAYLTAALAVLQGALFAVWLSYWTLFII